MNGSHIHCKTFLQVYILKRQTLPVTHRGFTAHRAGLVCFGASQKKGSHNVGYELNCENPSCQDILFIHRYKTCTHGEQQRL